MQQPKSKPIHQPRQSDVDDQGGSGHMQAMQEEDGNHTMTPQEQAARDNALIAKGLEMAAETIERNIIAYGSDGTKMIPRRHDDVQSLTYAAAIRALIPPTHYVVVPREPTPEQHEAGGEAFKWFQKMTEQKQVQRRSVWDTIYRAMINTRLVA